MADGILGNSVGAFGFPKTYVLTDENGTEFTATYVESETIFTATDSQVAEGFIYAGDSGVSTGTREFLAYRTVAASCGILPGESFSIPLEKYDQYNYTKFQCIIAKYNTTSSNSVEADRIAIGDNVYAVNSTEVLANITKNTDTKSIDLNIVNDTDDFYIIHYFTYKEETLQ